MRARHPQATTALLLLCAVIAVTGALLASHAIAQEGPSRPARPSIAPRLNELSVVITRKLAQLDALEAEVRNSGNAASADDRQRIVQMQADIAELRSTFELIALGDLDTDVLATPEAEADFNWRNELADIAEPLISSLKSLTERPRQLSELRSRTERLRKQLAVTQQAITTLSALAATTLDSDAQAQLDQLLETWNTRADSLSQQLVSAESRLERLQNNAESLFGSFWDMVRSSLLGRVLTIVLAIAAAALTAALMRLLWWFYNTHLATKTIRRKSTWYRLLAYSYYLVTVVMALVAVLVVLYLREDVLLLALAILLLAVALISMRRFLPRYVQEVRLLLNIGPVREDERVIYNGIPWRVMSINLFSVLRNPALNGVLRVPLAELGALTSRPGQDNLWFPSRKDDFVLLGDGTFGRVLEQTPELVRLSVMGGMTRTYPTAHFYAMEFSNLSRDGSFGIPIHFGLDYSLQAISLDTIPAALQSETDAALKQAGYAEALKALIVELDGAGSSSLDFLIYAQFSSTVAADYFKLKRLMLQSAVRTANTHGWTIPFPQLVVHQATD